MCAHFFSSLFYSDLCSPIPSSFAHFGKRALGTVERDARIKTLLHVWIKFVYVYRMCIIYIVYRKEFYILEWKERNVERQVTGVWRVLCPFLTAQISRLKNTSIFFGRSTNVHPGIHTYTRIYTPGERKRKRQKENWEKCSVRLLSFVLLLVCRKCRLKISRIGQSVQGFWGKMKTKIGPNRESEENELPERNGYSGSQCTNGSACIQASANGNTGPILVNEWTKPHDEWNTLATIWSL